MPTETETPNVPDKSWNLRGLKDTRTNAIEAINNAAFVPPACKAMLVERLNAPALANVNLVRVDCHCQLVGQQWVLTASIAPL